MYKTKLYILSYSSVPLKVSRHSLTLNQTSATFSLNGRKTLETDEEVMCMFQDQF